ncbi:MAG: symmetrical bis(5'-nucleosyl)-tetraphosphatase [Pseudomonadales bacterium]|nr:symmetrical bis(5'-nucleosyl)-tetraphosphatase [Pseudomonadales bacterium]
MSTYVVGDIQGCLKPLRKLLKKIEFTHANDTLWCVGDLINRGPKSRDTLHFLQDMEDATRIVLGNHDLHCIALNEGAAPARGKDNLDDILEAPDSQELSDWLRSKPLAHHEALETRSGVEDFLMIHAGIAPSWSLQTTLNLAAEVEHALEDDDYKDFLKNMYGDEPIRWSDKLRGTDRLRTITNYLTRIRFCDDIGSLRLDIKEGLCSAPSGFRPWFEYEKITPTATILFGHWAALEGVTNRPHVYALDTGYVWGRSLTMLRLEDKQLFAFSN